jgi:hypothetical protein
LLEGSGGLVDVLCKAWRLLHDNSALSARIQRSELETMTRKVFNVYSSKDASDLLVRMFNVVAVHDKVIIFNVSTDDTDGLDNAILRALVDNMRPDYTRADTCNSKPGGEKCLNLALLGGFCSVHAGKSTSDENFEREDMGWWVGRSHWIRRQETVQAYDLHVNALRIALLVDRVPEAQVQLEAAEELWTEMKRIWTAFKRGVWEGKTGLIPTSTVQPLVEGWDKNVEYFVRYYIEHLHRPTEGEDYGAVFDKSCGCTIKEGTNIGKPEPTCKQTWWSCMPADSAPPAYLDREQIERIVRQAHPSWTEPAVVAAVKVAWENAKLLQKQGKEFAERCKGGGDKLARCSFLKDNCT